MLTAGLPPTKINISKSATGVCSQMGWGWSHDAGGKVPTVHCEPATGAERGGGDLQLLLGERG